MAARARVYTPNNFKNKVKPDGRRRRNPRNEVEWRTMPQDDPDEDRFFVIEKILAKRRNAEMGYDEYLVRWANYPPDWDSWEPVKELEINSRDLINEFDKTGRYDPTKEELHCTCRRPYRFDQGGMIQCFNCLSWYHFDCLKMNMEMANSFARYYCNDCMVKNPNLEIKFKGKKRVPFY